MKTKYLLLFLFLVAHASAQTPVSETIHANSIEAKVWSNGALFGYNNERSFKIAKSEADTNRLTVFRRVAPWIGGYDVFGSAKVAAGNLTGTKTDFTPGFHQIDGFNQIWKVTKAQLQAHWADFQDNGVIDHPIDAIMQWPGTVALTEYVNGTPTPVSTKIAPFFDNNHDGLYQPLEGDLPFPIFNGYSLQGLPDEMLFFTFHDSGIHEATSSGPLNMQILCTMWAYSCPEEPAFDNTIFMKLEYWNRGNVPLDSVHVGLAMNVEIGKGNDDFIGCVTETGSYPEGIFYAYNGDAFDENGFEDTPPAVGMFRVYNNHMVDLPIPDAEPPTYFLRIGNTDEPVVGMGYPASPQAFYNYLTGHWADGTPLRSGGNGYHPNDTSPAVPFIYPGLPGDASGWSETTAGNAPGLRRALASFDYQHMNVNEREEANFCFTWVRPADTPNAVSAAVEEMARRQTLINSLYDLPIPLPPCLETIATHAAGEPNAWSIIPDPNAGAFRIVAPKGLKTLLITDFTGKIIYKQTDLHTSDIEFDLPLPSGVYFLTVLTDTNQRRTQKIVVVR